MKKIVIMSALLACGITQTYAADGEINVNGLVTDKTCDIVTAGGPDLDVTLPIVSRSMLATAGQTTGRTAFQINLANCTQYTKVATYFEPGPTVDFNSGRLINQEATGAKNVDIQLVGSNGKEILVKAIGVDGVQENSQIVDVSAQGTADLDYFAEYYATGSASSGIVTTSVKYTIIYP